MISIKMLFTAPEDKEEKVKKLWVLVDSSFSFFCLFVCSPFLGVCNPFLVFFFGFYFSPLSLGRVAGLLEERKGGG